MKPFTLFALLAPLVSALWPMPASYTHGKTVLWIDNNVKVDYSSSGSYGDKTTRNDILQAAIKRTYDAILTKTFVPWKFHPRNSNFEPSGQKNYVKHIVLKQTGTDPKNVFKALAGELDESYSLDVSENGEVTITAKTSIGLVRGLTTFTQLFFKHSKGGAYTNLAPVAIKDKPVFQHRGLNMDVARNFYPVADIKRMIDSMAFTKMNRFHIHITDGQSWPLEVPALPELAEKGRYSPGLTYSPADLKEIQHYGALQGVQTTIEIDMPGHTSSIWFAYPELITAFNVQPNWDTYCAEPPCGSLKLNSTKVYDFLGKLLDDVLPRIAPYTSYYYSGGDEVNANAYNLDETVKSNDTKVIGPLIQKMVDFVHNKARKNGLTPVVWEEMLLQWNLTLGKDVVVQTWQSDDAVTQTTAKGYKALVGNYNYWYLDCGKGQWLDFQPGESSQKFWPYLDYCNPVKNWRLIYSYDPYTGVAEKDKHLVIGGEAHLWAEQTDPVTIDKMAWPRGAAVAEILWSGPKDANGKNRSQVEASPRLSDMRERLVARGVMAEPIQMPFCIQNGTNCAL